MKFVNIISILLITLLFGTFSSFADSAGSKPDEAKILFDAKTQGLSKEIVEKLSPDQLTDVLTSLKALDKGIPEDGMGGSMVLILVPLFFFVTILLIPSIPLYLHFRKQRLLHETLRAMVEKGTEIPPQLLMPPTNKKSDFRKGTIFITTGLAISSFLMIYQGIAAKAWAFGLIPLIIGVGYLIAWKFQAGSNGNQEK